MGLNHLVPLKAHFGAPWHSHGTTWGPHGTTWACMTVCVCRVCLWILKSNQVLQSDGTMVAEGEEDLVPLSTTFY